LFYKLLSAFLLRLTVMSNLSFKTTSHQDNYQYNYQENSDDPIRLPEPNLVGHSSQEQWHAKNCGSGCQGSPGAGLDGISI
jgi:hypothetical protein